MFPPPQTVCQYGRPLVSGSQGYQTLPVSSNVPRFVSHSPGQIMHRYDHVQQSPPLYVNCPPSTVPSENQVFYSQRKLENINEIIAASQLEGGIYIGDTISTLKQNLLIQYQIGAVLCCNKEASKNLQWCRKLNIHHKYIEMQDAYEYPIIKHFAEGCKFIEEMRKKKVNVLVQCHAGVSRSVTIVCAYLMQKNKWPVQQALHFVRERRYRAKPNHAFLEQLESYWTEIRQQLFSGRQQNVDHIKEESVINNEYKQTLKTQQNSNIKSENESSCRDILKEKPDEREVVSASQDKYVSIQQAMPPCVYVTPKKLSYEQFHTSQIQPQALNSSRSRPHQHLHMIEQMHPSPIQSSGQWHFTTPVKENRELIRPSEHHRVISSHPDYKRSIQYERMRMLQRPTVTHINNCEQRMSEGNKYQDYNYVRNDKIVTPFEYPASETSQQISDRNSLRGTIRAVRDKKQLIKEMKNQSHHLSQRQYNHY